MDGTTSKNPDDHLEKLMNLFVISTLITQCSMKALLQDYQYIDTRRTITDELSKMK